VTVPVGRPVVRIWAKDLYPADEVVNGRSKAEGIGNFVVLAALTGLRQGELFALRDRHIDLEALTVRVDHGAYQGDLVPVKTRASRRRVDLSSTAARILRRQLLARKPNELGLVRPSPRKLTGLRFHDLRHTNAAVFVLTGDTDGAAEADLALAETWWRAGERDRCSACLERAAELIREGQASETSASVLAQIARFQALFGEPEAAIDRAQEVFAWPRHSGGTICARRT